MAANQLLLAAAAGGLFEECVRLIDEDDADVNACNTNGTTALHVRCPCDVLGRSRTTHEALTSTHAWCAVPVCFCQG